MTGSGFGVLLCPLEAYSRAEEVLLCDGVKVGCFSHDFAVGCANWLGANGFELFAFLEKPPYVVWLLKWFDLLLGGSKYDRKGDLEGAPSELDSLLLGGVKSLFRKELSMLNFMGCSLYSLLY